MLQPPSPLFSDVFQYGKISQRVSSELRLERTLLHFPSTSGDWERKWDKHKKDKEKRKKEI